MMIMSAAFWKNTCLMKTRNVLKKKKEKRFYFNKSKINVPSNICPYISNR